MSYITAEQTCRDYFIVTGELFLPLFLADKLCNKTNDNNQNRNVKQPVD